jgi:type III pantothenate kinase
MHLAIDVGNTESVIGLFEPGTLEVRASWRYSTSIVRTPDELLLLYRGLLREGGVALDSITRVVIGSVVPSQTGPLQRMFSALSGIDGVHLLEGAAGLPIVLDVDEPRTVGADRIANTLAAAHLFREDMIVVDLGTATTYDCIGAEGTFFGGVISPGVLAGQEWLAGRTAKLPRVEFRPPERVIGRRTESCLQSGLFYTVVDAVDGVIRRILEEWDRPNVRVIATGGHAPIVAEHSATIESVHPNLTLVGIELAGNHLAGGAGKR